MKKDNRHSKKTLLSYLLVITGISLLFISLYSLYKRDLERDRGRGSDPAKISRIDDCMMMYTMENNDVPFDERGQGYALYKLLPHLNAKGTDYEDKVYFCIPSLLDRKKRRNKNIDDFEGKIIYFEYEYLNKSLKDLSSGDIILIENHRIITDDTERSHIYFLYYSDKRDKDFDTDYSINYGAYRFADSKDAFILGKNIYTLDKSRVLIYDVSLRPLDMF